jgi:hypothetical protein
MLFRLTAKHLIVLGCLALLAGAGAVWYFWPDPVLADALNLQQELLGDPVRALPIAEQYRMQQRYFDMVQQMSAGQQRTLWNEQRRLLVDRIDRLFSLPPAEQQALVDAEIDRIEALRRTEEQQGKVRPGPPGSAAGSTRSLDERERMLKHQLDQTAPHERALLARFFKRYTDRRQERGLPPGPFPDGL